MSEFPECLIPRHEYEDEDGRLVGQNGQRCHRIEFHSGDCIFDRPPEFLPTREPTNFGRGRFPYAKLVPNPKAEA